MSLPADRGSKQTKAPKTPPNSGSWLRHAKKQGVLPNVSPQELLLDQAVLKQLKEQTCKI